MVGFLLFLNKLFPKVIHPFNLNNNNEMTYAKWQYEKGENTILNYLDFTSRNEMFENKTVLDMDDYNSNGYNSNFGNPTVSALKAGGHAQVLSKPDGSVGHTVNNSVVEDTGNIRADGQTDYLTVFYYSLGIVFSNYHTTLN